MCSLGESHNPRWAGKPCSMLLSCLISKFRVSVCSEDRVLLCISWYHPPKHHLFSAKHPTSLSVSVPPSPEQQGAGGLELGCPMHSGLFSWPLVRACPRTSLDMTWCQIYMLVIITAPKRQG